jgi:hypothetical protein
MSVMRWTWRVGFYGISAFGTDLLAVIAMVITLFAGRYPQPVFDFVMGMNRWCSRVLAYAALMRDEYPPFRLDSGGPEPVPGPAVPPPAAPPGHQAPLPA